MIISGPPVSAGEIPHQAPVNEFISAIKRSH